MNYSCTPDQEHIQKFSLCCTFLTLFVAKRLQENYFIFGFVTKQKIETGQNMLAKKNKTRMILHFSPF